MLLRIRQHEDTERKLGGYFFPRQFKAGSQRVFDLFLRIFEAILGILKRLETL